VSAVEFIEASGVPESMWPNFREWFSWFEDRGMVGVAKNGDDVVGVALARCSNSSQPPKHYEHSDDGDNVFVDLCVTSTCGNTTDLSRKALKCLLTILWDRFGPRRRITFNRNGNFKAYPYNKFMRKALS
jgi:hypothetical protein